MYIHVYLTFGDGLNTVDAKKTLNRIHSQIYVYSNHLQPKLYCYKQIKCVHFDCMLLKLNQQTLNITDS